MKFLSVSNIKQHRRPSGLSRPDPEALIGRVYDLLMATKGQPVDVTRIMTVTSTRLTVIIRYLEDFYGLDIRSIPIEKTEKCLGKRRRAYIVVGEWCGRVYLDYTKAATERAEEQ